MKLALRRLLIFLVVLTMVIPAGLAYAATNDGTAVRSEEAVAETPAGEGDVGEIDPSTLHVPKLGEITDEEDEASAEAVSGEITLEDIAQMDEEELNKTVRVSIFMDDKRVLDQYSVKQVNSSGARSLRSRLESRQANVERNINLAIGRKMKVKWRFTLAVNAISAEVTYKDIGKILKVKGVRSVELEKRYKALDDADTAQPDTSLTSSGMTGATTLWKAGYTGAGTKIAIIDTGIDYEHQSFDPDAFEYAISQDEMEDALMTAEDIPPEDYLNGHGEYINAKIPFAYNYVDSDMDIEHVNDTQGEHGSHVAGIAAANRYVDTDGDGKYEDAAESVYAVGMAPDAQLIVMKVFGKYGGAYDSDYMAAIMDAMILGCDSCNLSLGSAAAGFTFSNEYQEVMNTLSSEYNDGMVVSMSAGNSGYWPSYNNMLDGLLFSDDVNMDTVGSPGSYINSLAVASAENIGTTGKPMLFNGENNVYPTESDSKGGKLSDIPGDYDYVYIDSLGYKEEYSAVNEKVSLKGKIVIINRGSLTFVEKGNNLIDFEPAALIVANNQAGTIGMQLDDYTGTFPMASITKTDADMVKEISTVSDQTEVTIGESTEPTDVKFYTGQVNISSEVSTNITTENLEDTEMSEFSSWGIPGSLLMKPEITAPGGNIYSVAGTNRTKQGTIAGGTDQYELMSGTSMAAPHIAGLSATLLQYIRENEKELADVNTDLFNTYSDRAIAQSLLMSTAVPMRPYAEEGNKGYLSVLQQGAGLADVYKAVSSPSVLMMSDAGLTTLTGAAQDGKVKAELGDDPERKGTYSYSFKLYNLTEEDLEYNLSTDIFTQAVEGEYGDLLSPDTMDLDANVGYTWESAEKIDRHDVDKDGDTDGDDAQAILDYLTGENDGSQLNLKKGEMDEDGNLTTKDAQLLLNWTPEDYDSTYVIPAFGEADVTVNISLSSIPEDFYNGAYIEGYTYAECISTTEEGESLQYTHSIPILGFYGNWTDPSMYDRLSYYDYWDALVNENFDITGLIWEDDVITYADALSYSGTWNTNYMTLKKNGSTFRFTGNPYAVEESFPYDKLAISSDTEIKDFQYNLIRPAGTVGYVADALDAEKNITKTLSYGVKATNFEGLWYDEDEGKSVNKAPKRALIGDKVGDYGLEKHGMLRVGLYAVPEYNAMLENESMTDADSGILSADAFKGLVESGKLGSGAAIEYEFTVDDEAPVIAPVSGEESITADENNIIKVNVTDDLNIAYVALMDINGAGEDNSGLFYEVTAPEQGVIELNAENALGTESGWVAVFAGDYAGNESAVAVAVSETPAVEDPGAVTAVSVDPAEITLLKGMIADLVANVLPITADDKTFTWTSSDPTIVSVTEDGEITAVGEGEAFVTATSNGNSEVSGSCKVTVLNTELNGLAYDETETQSFVHFNAGEPSQLEFDKAYEDSDLHAAFVDENGKIIVSTFDGEVSVLKTVDPKNDYETADLAESYFPVLDAAMGMPEIGASMAYIYGPYLIMGNTTPEALTEDDPTEYSGIPYLDIVDCEEYTDGAYLAGIALKGYKTVDLGEDTIDLPSYYLLDENGKIWSTEVSFGEDGYPAFTEFELVAETGFSAGYYYQSLYYDGTFLYWSQWYTSQEVSNLYVIDPKTGGVFEAGDFGESIWPVTGLYEMPETTASGSGDEGNAVSEATSELISQLRAKASLTEIDRSAVEKRISDTFLSRVSAPSVSEEEIMESEPAEVQTGETPENPEALTDETAAGTLNAARTERSANKVELPVQVRAENDQNEGGNEPAEEDTVDVVISEATASANGFVTISYDPEKLSFKDASSALTYKSIHVDEEKGMINFAYASGTPVDAETVLADIEFVKPCEDSVVTVTTKERGGELSLDEKEEIQEEGAGHNFGDPVYTWAEDNSEVTATRTCKNDPKHVETETAKTTKEVKEPTYDEAGYTRYTVSFDNEAFAPQTKETEIPKLAAEVVRIFGSTRYETSLKAADELKLRLGTDKFDTVILACGSNYADALAGSYLSCLRSAPILLVDGRADHISAVQAYIKDNLKSGGTIYMLGGTAVVPDSAVAGLTEYQVKRLWGTDRYATNVAILKEAGLKGDEILVASGTGFADSLSAAAVGKPILLVKGALTNEQKDYLKDVKGSTFTIIGGSGAVSDALMNEVKAYGAAERVWGQNRYETSVEVAKKYFDGAKVGVLAYGDNFPDGLCGGVLANTIGGPLVLTGNGKTDEAVKYAGETGMKSGMVLGGPTLISDDSAKAIFHLGADAEIIVR